MDNEKESKETMNKSTGKSKKTSKRKISKKKEITSKEITVQKFKDLEGKFLLVKVGNNDRPATDQDIEDIEIQLLSLFEKNNINCLAFVTHHAVEMEIIDNLT